MQHSKRVREWLMRELPGHYDRPSSDECLEAARVDYIAATGDSTITVEDFEAVLWSVGLKPQCIRNGPPPVYRLPLPSPSAGDTTAALRKVQGERG